MKLFRNKKALSPVISTILMIMVVMVGMTIVFSSVVFYADSYKAGSGGSILESMTLEDVWIQPAGNVLSSTVNITVYNTGTQANLGTDSGVVITVAAIYVNGTALNNPLTGTINFNGIQVKAGSHVTIEGQFFNGNFVSSNTYDFKIVTERGSHFEALVHYVST